MASALYGKFPAIGKRAALAGLALLILNEIRGLIMAAPILVAMYHNGGSWMQAWLLLCVAVSVVVPVMLWARTNRNCRMVEHETLTTAQHENLNTVQRINRKYALKRIIRRV